MTASFSAGGVAFAHSAVADTTQIADASSAWDAATAEAIAAQYGHSVIIDSYTTETEQAVANPDGTQTLTDSSDPVRAQDASGAWVPIDTSLSTGSDGLLAPGAAAVPVEFSAGKSDLLARVQSDSGSWLSELWPNGSLPSPTVSGNVATYANVYPGVDLQLTATATGFSEVLVVKTAQAAQNPALASVGIGIAGATLSPAQGTGSTDPQSSGSVAANASNGLASPSPAWWDSSTDGSGPGGPGGAGIPMPVPDTVSASSYTVDVAAVANQPDVTYPVYVDPSFGVADRTFVDNAYPGQSYWNGSQASDNYEHVGYVDAADSDDGKSHLTRSFWQYNLSGLAGTDILSAQFQPTLVYSYTCTTSADTQVDLWQVGGISNSTTWNAQPSWQSYLSSVNAAAGYNSTCPGKKVGFDVQSAIQAKADTNAPTITFGLRADSETDPVGWKKFAAAASLVVTLNHLPSVPSTSSLGVTPCGFTCSASNNQYAQSTDADNDTLAYQFEVQTQQSDGTWSSSVPYGTSRTWAPGKLANLSVGPLADGTYRYDVRAGDGTDWSNGFSSWLTFTVDTHAPLPPRLTESGGLSTSKSSVAGTVGVTTESVTITPNASDHAYGYAYAIYPSSAPVVFPTNLACGTQTGGYITVCPTSVGAPITVQIEAPDDHSTFAAITFDAAGNAPSSVSSVAFYASGDYTSSHAGHSWLTDQISDTSGACAAAPVSDSAVQPTAQDNLTTLSGNACWKYDGGAPASNGATFSYTGNGALSFTGGASDAARASGPALNTTKNLTVGAWVKPGTLGSTRWYTMLSQDPRSGGTDSGFYLQITPSHYWRFCMRAQDSTRALQCATSNATFGSGWTYVAGVYDARDNEVLLYVFGGDSPGTPVVDSYDQAAGGATPPSASGSFTVGQAISGSAQTDQFIGEVLDPVAVQGVMDSGQLQAFADLHTPSSLTAPIVGS